MLAMRMVSAIRHELQRQISVKTLFQQATVAALAIHLQGKMKLKEPAAIRAGVRPERAPLSFGQERLWFIHQLEGSVQYHIPEAIRIRGDLRREALSSALREIVRRHEVLRTVIKEENEVVWQETLAWEEWELGWIEGGEDTLQPLMTALLLQPMDLTRDFMLRATLIGLGPGEHVLVLITHHIASDGWSAGILLSELWTLYGSFTKNEELSLPKLPLQYTDYACWQRNHLSGLLLEGHIDYWKQKLSGVEMLMLPVDHSHLPEQGRKGANLYRRLGKELSEGLRRLSRQQECTLFMILLTVFKILLSRWSGQQDICVGSPIAGRTQRELEGLIGFFVNTLALRSDLSGDPSVQELLQRVRVTALDAYEHQEIPFEKVVEAVVRQRDLIRNPLFQVMFILQHVQEQALPTPEGLEWSPVLFVQKTAVFELTFCVTESPEELGLIVEYCVDLYEEATITRMMDHFIQLLQAVVRHPEKKISELPMLGDMESRRMVEMGKGKVIAYDREATVVSLFSEQALQMQEAAAVVFEDRILSYRQLDESSTRLANYLKRSGVGVETPVAVCMERSPELLIGMLGIMKAGGAYVPIDPDYPVERIAYMLSDTGVSLVLCSPASKAALPEGFSGRALLVDDAGQEPVTLPLVALQSGNLAYVMYTSGSTGRPKGVMVEHRNITSLVKGGGYMSLTSSDVLLGAGSPSFDAITHEYWGALLNGGKLVLCSKHTLLDHRLFKTVMRDNKVNKMFFTTGWFNQLVDAEVGLFAGLEVVMVGGEKLSPGHIDKFYKAHPCIRLFNVYGPTENTTFSLICPVAQPYGGEDPPIGRPLGNRSAYILNALQLAPAGVPGEICVGGDGVARGYFGQRELTAEKFLPDLFGEEGGRIYRTGDIGKWLPDGNIAYLGRMDEQLKIRGHRIEPGEIESVVQASGMVHQVVVLGRKDTMGRMGLVGYVVAGGNDFDRQGMVSYLQQFLPEYMIPPLWVEMEEMPLNSSGKVDRRALPEPERKGPEDGYVAARDETEEQLVTIWQEVLGMERIGVHDNFFQLGGNSLIMLSLLKKIRQLCPTIYLKDLFIHQTVGRLAMFIAEKMGQDRRDGMEWADGHLILLNDADGSRPLFVIPGSQGFSDGYDELARAFDGRYTVYGIQMRGTKGSEQPVQDMVEIAALNIASIKTVQPEGPYRLVAHCFGAHAAYEMVRQLEAAGDEVAFVAMLDISVILNRLRIEGDNIPVAAMMASIRNLTRSFKLVADPLPEWLQTLEATLHALPQEERVKHIATCLHEQYPGRKDAVEFVVRLFHLEMVNVLVKYTPADSIGCPLVVVKAEEEDWRGYEPDLGWSERAPMHHVITSPGNHNSMVRGEHAVLLAHRLLAVTGDV